MHYLFKQLVPPLFHTLKWYSFKYGWKGDYASFEEATNKAGGYDAEHILQSIVKSTQKVVSGEVPYERDGIVYDTVKMNFPLLSTLLRLALENNNELTVLDFGGSLGTSYFQNKAFLKGVKTLHWCIVEQPNYVKEGKAQFENDQLHFYYTIEECLNLHRPQLILFNSVIQYLEDPYTLIANISKTGIPNLYFDATAYLTGSEDRYTIQHVPPVFYGKEVSYACTFFSKSKMFDFLKQYYVLNYEFISEPDKYYLELMPFLYEGQLWKLK